MQYARGKGPPPPELEVANAIDRFGAQAIMGRGLYRGEALKMNYAGRVYQAVQALDGAKDAGDMARLMEQYPETVKLAQRALKMTYG